MGFVGRGGSSSRKPTILQTHLHCPFPRGTRLLSHGSIRTHSCLQWVFSWGLLPPRQERVPAWRFGTLHPSTTSVHPVPSMVSAHVNISLSSCSLSSEISYVEKCRSCILAEEKYIFRGIFQTTQQGPSGLWVAAGSRRWHSPTPQPYHLSLLLLTASMKNGSEQKG